MAVIKKLQPEAELIESKFGVVSVSKIMDTNAFDFDKACMSAGWMKELEKDENLTVKTYKKECCNSYFKELEKYGIRSSTISEFMNPLQEQKHFEKQLFINICFACSMPLSTSSC